MTPQEVNLENQKKIIKEKEVEMKKNISKNSNSVPFSKSASRDIPEVRAPENVQEILNRIKQKQVANTDTQDESSSNNDRILSDMNVSDSKKGRKKAPSISISTK